MSVERSANQKARFHTGFVGRNTGQGEDEDEDEDSAERLAPWIVWERAEKGGAGPGGGDDMMAMLMAMQGSR